MTMSRVRVYDAADMAREMTETFKKRGVEEERKFPWKWPQRMQFVGESLAVAYSSDKWEKEKRNERKWTLWKHIAESRNRALCKDGFLRDFDDPSRAYPTIGPDVDFAHTPMPSHFSILALFEEANIQLHTGGTDEEPELIEDEGIVKVTVKHGFLGGSKILWSETEEGGKDQPFIFVYTVKDGPLMLIIGDELDIEADGIVG